MGVAAAITIPALAEVGESVRTGDETSGNQIDAALFGHILHQQTQARELSDASGTSPTVFLKSGVDRSDTTGLSRLAKHSDDDTHDNFPQSSSLASVVNPPFSSLQVQAAVLPIDNVPLDVTLPALPNKGRNSTAVDTRSLITPILTAGSVASTDPMVSYAPTRRETTGDLSSQAANDTQTAVHARALPGTAEVNPEEIGLKPVISSLIAQQPSENQEGVDTNNWRTVEKAGQDNRDLLPDARAIASTIDNNHPTASSNDTLSNTVSTKLENQPDHDVSAEITVLSSSRLAGQGGLPDVKPKITTADSPTHTKQDAILPGNPSSNQTLPLIPGNPSAPSAGKTTTRVAAKTADNSVDQDNTTNVGQRSIQLMNNSADSVVSPASASNPAAVTNPSSAQLTGIPSSPENIRAQVVQHVVDQVQAGRKEISFQLNPHELGQVRVQLTPIGPQQLSSRLIVENPHALDSLQQNLQQLKQSLAHQGVSMEHITVVMISGGEASGNTLSNGNPQHQDPHGQMPSQGQGGFSSSSSNQSFSHGFQQQYTAGQGSLADQGAQGSGKQGASPWFHTQSGSAHQEQGILPAEDMEGVRRHSSNELGNISIMA